VGFERGCTPGYIALAGMEAERSVLLGGRRVDLRTPADLSRYFREDVMREAVLQHAR
jgi:predicted nucleotidyltransferase